MTSSPFIKSLQTVGETDQAGGKAQNLAQLLATGFPVPPGIVLLPGAFEDGELRAVARHHLTTNLAAWRERRPDVTFAVRSSGRGEDSTTAAFAGVFQTILNVKGDDAVCQAINTVYRSRHDAAAYRRAHDLPERQEMAVVVQELVPAGAAGVCFSRDPMAPQEEQILCNAAWGMGAGVMDGRVPADTYWVQRRDLAPAQQRIAAKTIQLIPAADGDLTEMAVPGASLSI